MIIDEPEVHLHPKWEVVYAKIIVLLSKLGIPIIVSSHSHYFLQESIKYIMEYNTEDKTKIYFWKKNTQNDNTSFADVTDYFKPVFWISLIYTHARDIFKIS